MEPGTEDGSGLAGVHNQEPHSRRRPVLVCATSQPNPVTSGSETWPSAIRGSQALFRDEIFPKMSAENTAVPNLREFLSPVAEGGAIQDRHNSGTKFQILAHTFSLFRHLVSVANSPLAPGS